MSDYNEFFKRLSSIESQDGRFRQDAYLFVMASLTRAIEGLKKPRHISGAELLGAIRGEAEAQYGPMAATVFAHWGIKNSLDFGHIVFNMVREGILSKTESDKLEDFQDDVFFENLFDDVSGYRLPDEDGKLKGLASNQK